MAAGGEPGLKQVLRGMGDMKISMSLKAFAIVLAAGSFGFTGTASAYDDDDNAAGAAVGILGQVIGGAIEAEQAKDAAIEQERRCRRPSVSRPRLHR